MTVIAFLAGTLVGHFYGQKVVDWYNDMRRGL